MKKLLFLAVLAATSVGLLAQQSDWQKQLERYQQQQQQLRKFQMEYLGRLSANRYDAESTSNSYGIYGSPYSPNSVNNPYSTPGRAAQSPYSMGFDSPKLFAEDDTYLGNLNQNQFDPDSVANPYGPYGSRYSPKSINNPFSVYGSPYSPLSATNPYATQAPKILGPTDQLKFKWEQDP